jgi:hypothetical protein
MAKDPIGFDAGDANLYRYVGNDPTNRVDPSGRSDRPDKSNTLIYAKNGDGTYNVEYPDGHGETKNTNGQDIKEFLRTLYPHLNVMSRDEWNQAFGKQLEPFGAVAVKTDFQHIPVERIDSMLKDGLAISSGAYVYVADVSPEGG